jgi:hypothetical protein
VLMAKGRGWGMGDLKDHQIAQTVNALTTIAREYGGTEQLRERIAQVIVPILKGQGFPRSIVSAYAASPTATPKQE